MSLKVHLRNMVLSSNYTGNSFDIKVERNSGAKNTFLLRLEFIRIKKGTSTSVLSGGSVCLRSFLRALQNDNISIQYNNNATATSLPSQDFSFAELNSVKGSISDGKFITGTIQGAEEVHDTNP